MAYQTVWTCQNCGQQQISPSSPCAEKFAGGLMRVKRCHVCKTITEIDRGEPNSLIDPNQQLTEKEMQRLDFHQWRLGRGKLRRRNTKEISS